MKLTDEIIEKVAEAVGFGNYIEQACLAAGITRKTYLTWMRDAKALAKKTPRRPTDRQKKLLLFIEKVQAAEATAESADLMNIDSAGARDWRAAAWKLERRFPQRWGTNAKEIAELQRNVTKLALALARAGYGNPLDAATETSPAGGTGRPVGEPAQPGGADDDGAGAIVDGEPGTAVGGVQ